MAPVAGLQVLDKVDPAFRKSVGEQEPEAVNDVRGEMATVIHDDVEDPGCILCVRSAIAGQREGRGQNSTAATIDGTRPGWKARGGLTAPRFRAADAGGQSIASNNNQTGGNAYARQS